MNSSTSAAAFVNTPIGGLSHGPVPGGLKRSVLWCGPLVTLFFAVVVSLEGMWVDPAVSGSAVWCALALWSPLPVSVASVLCEHDRDSTLVSMRGFWGSALRGVLLPFALLGATDPAVRLNARAAFGGFGVAAAVTLAAGLV
jgi:hypothetical protein